MRSSAVDRDVWFKAYLTVLATLGPELHSDTRHGSPAIAADVAVRAYRERFPDDTAGAPTAFTPRDET